MIEFTIKTLDSNNHHFSVDDEITVQQLKERVRETMGIEINLQRLIFCGRVMQDEKKLAEYDVNGKVVHLVQRAPPSPESRYNNDVSLQSSQFNTSNDSNNGAQHQIRRLMAMTGPPSLLAEEQQSMSLSPTTGRLEFIRRMISEIKTTLASLRAHIGNEENTGAPTSSAASVEPGENDTASGAAQEEPEPQLDENGDEAPDVVIRALNARRRAIRALRARHSRPRDLGLLLEELESLQDQLTPFRVDYVRILRAGNNPEQLHLSEERRQRDQRTVDLVSDAIHSFAHAYHAVSDINYQVGQRNPRLTSDTNVMRSPIPMQAHINVVQSNRRPPQPTNNANTTATNGGSAPATQTSANAAPSADANNAQGAQGIPATAQAGRNTTQPTVNINIQPDPITYQVEIETRMPIAFALENALLNGLTTTAVNNQQPSSEQNQAQPTQPNQQNQTGQQNQPGQQNQTSQPNPTGQQNPNGQQNQNGQPGQANRRQVLFDFENLFRGLGQAGALGGVEVVMSMEEIPQGGPLGAAANIAASNMGASGATAAGPQPAEGGGNAPQPLFGADSAMPWGGPPTADLLQNIVSSVIRQGLVPGVEGVALHAQVPGGAQQGPGQIIGQVHGFAPGPVQGLGQMPNAAPGNSEQENQNALPRQPNLHLRRATTTTRARAVSLANLIYDRFLQCDSPHARRRLLRRREQHQQQAASLERLRAERGASQNFEMIVERNSNITLDHLRTVMQLLNDAPAHDSWLNALLVTITRQNFLAEVMQGVNGEPGLIPNEFLSLRLLLRTYTEDLLSRSGNTDGNNAFQAVADFFVDQNLDFINRMNSITPIRRDVNVHASLQALIRCRLPGIIATVMSGSTSEAFVARFFAIFTRFFKDVCGLIMYCCLEGLEGLRAVYMTYLNEAVQDSPENVRQTMTTLGMENLNHIACDLPSHAEVILPYIRRREGVSSTARLAFQESTPMELSPCPPRDEPMQTTPPRTPMVRAMQISDSEMYSESVDDPPARPAVVPRLRSMACSTPIQASTPVAAATPNKTATVTSASDATALNASGPSPIRPRISKKDMPESASSSNTTESPDNVRLVPPVLLLQHWGEEWVPVFSRDQETQRAEPQEPYSDAYLSGMPSRKRRRVCEERPPTSLDGFMDESFREVVERPPATEHNFAMRTALREHMRNLTRSRASDSLDYNQTQFTSAESFLRSPRPRPNVSEQPEDSSEP